MPCEAASCVLSETSGAPEFPACQGFGRRCSSRHIKFVGELGRLGRNEGDPKSLGAEQSFLLFIVKGDVIDKTCMGTDSDGPTQR
jgi:hypothetical protein